MLDVKPKRPVVRYHGGKWLLAPWIISYFPNHRIYTESFGGGASVLLQKERSYAEIYNDLDNEIVNLFSVVRDHGAELRDRLRQTPFSRVEYRASFAVSDDAMEQARRTVIRSFMGFGSNALCREVVSGFRANSNRSGTTPAHDWANYPERLDGLIERLSGIVIENRPAVEVITSQDDVEALHYCDPPYVHSTRTTITKSAGGTANGHHGYNHEMTDDDHRDLAKVLHGLKGMVVLSGYPCDLYDKELFPDWYRVERQHLADGAKKRTEVLWLNPLAESRLENKQEGLF